MIILTGGCATPPNHQAMIIHLAQSLNASSEVLDTRYFPLQTFQALSRSNSTLRVYIEGDGQAWISRYRASQDPIPYELTLSELMHQDTYSERVYLARPCQFVWSEYCEIPVWTSLRYSQPMVDALNEALDKLKIKGPYQHIELIGFSGGGTLALLLAAGREDVTSVRTVAGNLSPHFVNRFHGVSATPDSLDPTNFSTTLATIPQLHFIGGKDSIITSDVYDNYRSFFSQKQCLLYYVNPDAGHHSKWKDSWLELLEIPVKCRRKRSQQLPLLIKPTVQ
ncbi:MAG: hypothetical protein KAG53_00255 [Endozoicomonadaceae bacterium]|nr:hypothetical protein [Endozoicomonadaceae bacterium]